MSYVFISYSKKNRDYARPLTDFLKNAGFNVWIDDELEPSEDWWRMIVRAVKDCGAFIVIMTPESEASIWVQKEIYLAEGKKPIFPILLNGDADLRESEVWSTFGRIHYEDVRDGSLPKEKFLEKLATKIPRQTQHGQNLVPPEINPLPDLEALNQKVLAMLPPPFEWCAVKGGQVVLEDNMGTHTVADFLMAKYCITYAQFQAFLDAKDGFYNREWWQGLAADADHKKQPGDQRFKIAIHPRENVSWYDSLVFCRWLSHKIGLQLFLPTEKQWQRAAIGDNEWSYPWGNNFNLIRCNTIESGFYKTVPVDSYPDEISPFGVLNMSGNVWEWTLTEYDNGCDSDVNSNTRVVRGGSWDYALSFARASFRFNRDLARRSSDLGFRVACVPFSNPAGD